MWSTGSAFLIDIIKVIFGLFGYDIFGRIGGP